MERSSRLILLFSCKSRITANLVWSFLVLGFIPDILKKEKKSFNPKKAVFTKASFYWIVTEKPDLKSSRHRSDKSKEYNSPMTTSLLIQKPGVLRPKFYVEVFDSESVFFATAQSVGKKFLRFFVDSKISKASGDAITGAVYGFRLKNFFPFSGIVKFRKEIPSRFSPTLCELELELEEELPG
ncbi:hypothetical protein ACE5IS_18910 [Leptospira wolffii]|uniref:Uncharacterized protein n=1 Tax=Leptospira wolffii TaxID=409998 RepID=A0ABV5BSB0_9LEPT